MLVKTKTLLRFFVTLAFSVLLLVGCENDPSTSQGKLEFTFSTSSGLSSGKTASESLKFLLITIVDKQGNKVYDRKKIELYMFSGKYLSEPIDLRSGSYLLTEFLVIDDAGNVKYATPIEGSKLAHLVEDPLPVDFNIVHDETTKVVPQVVAIDEFNKAEDFGYTTFSFDIVETIGFQIAVFVYDDLTENFQLTTSTLKVYGDNTSLFDQSIGDSTNRVVVKNGFSTYTLKVIKDGYEPYENTFTSEDLLSFKSDKVLIVKLFLSPKDVNKSIQFDGDGDYINLGNIYDSLNLPFSVSAWVNIDANVLYTFPILVSQDNSSIYNGFWFCINKTHLYVEFGDGRGNNSGSYKNGKSAYIGDLTGKWIYVTTTVRGANDIDLYVNGINVGGEWVGYSSYPMDSNFPNEDTHIGTVEQNGSRYFSKGNIDDLSVWKRSLSSDEVNSFMYYSFTGVEEGLIGHWNFNEDGGDTILDKSPYQYNGTLQGNAQRVESVIPGH